MSNPTHLKFPKTGRVLPYSAMLAKRGDMIPCTATGEILTGHIEDAEAASAAANHRKTAYLGNLRTGALDRYTDILAMRGDLIPVDSPEQWEIIKKTRQEASTVEAPEEDKPVVEPTTLTRTPEVAPPPPGEEQPMGEPGGIQLPNVDGMGAREAKTVLSEWALENFNHRLDRRQGLPEVVEQCKALIDGAQQAA